MPSLYDPPMKAIATRASLIAEVQFHLVSGQSFQHPIYLDRCALDRAEGTDLSLAAFFGDRHGNSFFVDVQADKHFTHAVISRV